MVKMLQLLVLAALQAVAFGGVEQYQKYEEISALFDSKPLEYQHYMGISTTGAWTMKDVPIGKSPEDIPIGKSPEDIPIGKSSEDIPIGKSPQLYEELLAKFAKKHEDFMSNIINRDEEMTFIVKLVDNTNFKSHQKILEWLNALPYGKKSKVGQDSSRIHNNRYDYVGKSHVLVRATPNDIEALNVTNPDILYYVPLLPETKVQRHLYTTDDACVSTNYIQYPYSADLDDNKFKQLLVHVAPMSNVDKEQFIQYLIQESSNSQHPFSVDMKSIKADKLSYAKFFIPNCQQKLDIATLLANRREVTWIEEAFPIVPLNRWSKGVCQSGDWEEKPFTSMQVGLNGTGQIIGFSDSGVDMSSCYFHDPDVSLEMNTLNPAHRKMVYYYSTQADEYDNGDCHGTHVGGTIAGYSSKNYGDMRDYNGVAPGAKLAFYDIGKLTADSLSTPANIGDIFDELHSAGAYISTNSWGSGSATGNPLYSSYGSLAQQADDWMWNNLDSLLVFSNGNSGTENSYVKNTVNPATLKNGISVGASGNDHDAWLGLGEREGGVTYGDEYDANALAYFSSRGPTLDGRIKPDIVAPGWWVTSAEGNAYATDADTFHCGLKVLDGTSMAAPAVAAGAGIIRQYFTDGYYPSGSATSADAFVPSGALLKAMIIASGQPLLRTIDEVGGVSDGIASSTYYPDSRQGYGRMQLNKVLHFDTSTSSPLNLQVFAGAYDSSHSLYKDVASSSTDTYTFTTASTTPSVLRVVLCFVDYKGDVSSSTSTGGSMKNQVTMIVEKTVNTVTTTYYAADADSTVQFVNIEDPAASTTYTITVTGTTVSYGSVSSIPYALVAVSDLATSPSLVDDDDTTFDVSTSSKISSFSLKGIILFAVVAFLVFSFSIGLYWYNMQRALIQVNQKRISPDELDDEILTGRALRHSMEMIEREKAERERVQRIARENASQSVVYSTGGSANEVFDATIVPSQHKK